MTTVPPIPAAPASDSEPAVLGGFRIGRPLGRGALGKVFEAAGGDGRRVALKVFDLAGDDHGEIAAAFERESALAMRLDHPGIVRAEAAGRDGRCGYIVMELVPGSDLAKHTGPGQRLPIATVLGIAIRVAEALDHAHRLGIVHRDVKPANILVDLADDIVKVADFGVARLGDAFRSRTGVIAGTPHYMSPEQLGDGDVDARTDVYALGVVLFEMLTGRLPHRGSSLGELLRHVTTQVPPRLLSLRADAPPALDELLASMLATDPRRRPDDAKAVANAIRTIAG